MSTEWLYKDQGKSIIVCCNGWGMDANPFRPLQSFDYDVLILSDYTSDFVVPDIVSLIEEYEEKVLLGWSMGVSYGQKLFSDHSGLFNRCIAVNGTLYPIDNDFGIAENVYRTTLQQMSKEALDKFYRRMCRSNSTLQQFTRNCPKRMLDNQLKELKHIGEYGNCLPGDSPIYSDVIISKTDYIIPTSNQYRFWKTYKHKFIADYHFPFYSYSSWDEMLESFLLEVGA